MFKRFFIPFLIVCAISFVLLLILIEQFIPEQYQQEFRFALILFFLGIFIVVSIIVYIITNYLRRNLSEIQKVVDTLASGDMNYKAPLAAPEIVSKLSFSLNKLIEELSQRMQKLYVEKEELNNLLSNLGQAVISIDTSGNITHISNQARDLLQISETEGVKLWDAIRDDLIIQSVKEVVEKKEQKNFETKFGERLFDVKIIPIQKSGQIVILAYDITEAKKFENLRKEFVANISHEFRTPLTNIKGFLETLLQDDFSNVDRAKEFLQIIEKNVNHLSKLVEDILELSRLETSKDILNIQKVDLGKTLKDLKDKMGTQIMSKKQTLDIDFCSEVSIISCDSEMIERAICNLVDNSSKYSQEGARILIEVRSGKEKVEISVIDNGPGIPQEALLHIFERFYRVDKARNREQGGYGLGLAIVKHIVQLHKGEVKVESKIGEGSKFTIILPIV